MSAATYNDLVGQWRRQPTANGAVAACDSLALQAETGGARQPSLARSMAEEASRAYPNDLEVLLSVGRMLLAHGQLQMAKRHLLGAAKLSAEPRAPRLLGEVLLRQGDAKRAVRALQRAIQLGATDEETHGWYESASAYVGVQAEQGREAVARAIDDGFSGAALEISDEDSDDDAPTMIASQQQEAVMAMMEAEQQTQRHRAKRPGRPERPAVPRDDEATDFVQLTAIAQDGAPTRVAADVPDEIAAAALPAEEIVDESTAMMSDTEIQRLNAIEARRSGKIKDPTTERVNPNDFVEVKSTPKPLAPAPEPPKPPPEPAKKKKIADDDSDDAWHLAVQKRSAEADAPPSVSTTKPSSRSGKKTSRTGMYVGSAAAAILLTLFAGVRTGRLPEIAQHLPPWLSGETPAAQPVVATTAEPAAPAPVPSGETAQAKNEPASSAKAEPKSEPANGDAEPKSENGDEGKTEPAASTESTTKPAPKPVTAYPRPRPRPTPKPEGTPKPKPPPPPPDPGAPEEPLWLGDPERN